MMFLLLEGVGPSKFLPASWSKASRPLKVETPFWRPYRFTTTAGQEIHAILVCVPGRRGSDLTNQLLEMQGLASFIVISPGCSGWAVD